MEPKKTKEPRRVIHCSDGTLEEYSSDDESDGQKAKVELPVVDPKTLTWFPWIWYQTTWVGSKTLSACDYVGESLANFFGITSPKFQFEINEYYRMKAEEAEAQRKEDLEMGGWTENNRNNLVNNSTSTEQIIYNKKDKIVTPLPVRRNKIGRLCTPVPCQMEVEDHLVMKEKYGKKFNRCSTIVSKIIGRKFKK